MLARWEQVKAHWRRVRLPQCQATHCKAPHIPIDYGPVRGPWSLDVGHVVSRVQARAMGWSRAQINHVSNTRPEHATCGRTAGAHEGNARRGMGRGSRGGGALPRPLEAGEW